ncbi:DNA glycosylase [Ramaria rubella]|nr:DNA glycosylase [Ramaria rubella]
MPRDLQRCERSSSITDLPERKVIPSSSPGSPNKSTKVKIASTYATASPFLDFPHPTPAEVQSVHALLVQTHGERPPTLTVSTRSDAPNVLDSLIDTILSQNTSTCNFTRTRKDLDATFGLHNFAAIAEAPQAKLYQAIRRGGLAQKKSKAIQAILHSVHAEHGSYSLQHLTSPSFTNAEIMEELQRYDGVGPKTAACVLLFSLGRESFAVDTHVFRLSHLLGWVPKKANRIMAQAHLDVMVPGALKYELHVLMVHHGRNCKGCKSHGAKGECVLKTWLRERETTVDTETETKVEEMAD